MPNKNSNPDSNPESEEDPDLSFASESHTPFGPAHRKAFDQSQSDQPNPDDEEPVDWTPDAPPPPPSARLTAADNLDPADGMVSGDTWVPPEGPAETHRTEDPDSNASQQPPTPPSNDHADSSGSAAGGADLIDANRTWIPSDVPTVDGLPSLPDSSKQIFDPNKTWVPSDTPTADGLPPTDEQQDADPNKTWMPSNTPTADGLPPTDGQQDADPNKTWMPSNTPTADGLPQNDNPNADAEDPNKTWMPSSTPTADGISRDPESEHDVEKTWTPTDSRTIDARQYEEETNDDPNKTWVPSSTPTADGVSDGVSDEKQPFDADSTWEMAQNENTPTQASHPLNPTTHNTTHNTPDNPAADDTNKTHVPSTAPTTSGSKRPELPADLTETKDVVEGARPSMPIPIPTSDSPTSDSPTSDRPTSDRPTDLNRSLPSQASSDATPGSSSDRSSSNRSTAHQGEVFQKTIGMRRPLDSSDLPPSDLGHDGSRPIINLDLPDSEMDPGDSHATQFWARQSGSDLNHSLTIRSRPVAGDKQFETPHGRPQKPDYQIVEKIGEGGMGAIFLANQMSLDRQLAIKTLKADRGSGSGTGSRRRSGSVERQRRDMFLAEALITANLVHPHIIPIHDLCETPDGLPFYSMKRVVGTPWCDRLREMGQDANLEVLMKVCDAIAYAHHNGVVNRDLKPENVMLGEFGEVLVLDWGLAVPSTPADKKKFNSPSAPYGAGTPAYMAPELWTGPEDIIGYWSDIYLLGAILFEIITGKAPHRFAKPAAESGNTGLWMVIDQVVRQNDIRKTKHTGELMDVALKAMETRPRDRFSSVLKFQEALKNFIKHEESRHLSRRAIETLEATTGATAEAGYPRYQSAVALFEEAQATWPENQEATTGLRKARLQYAALAHEKGDYDLGLQIAALEDGPSFVDVRHKLTRSRRIRNTLKSAVIAAAAIIVVVGIFSFIQSREIAQQNEQIIALNGTRETLLKDISSAQKNITEAQAKQRVADKKAIAAEQRAIVAATKATEASQLVAKAEARLSESAQKLEKADAQLMVASTKLNEADQKLAAANQTLNETEQKVADLQIKKSRSAVDLKNAEIAGLIRNGDYSSALTEVERLLSDLTTSPEMAALPERERQQRRIELQARRRQLLRRAVQVDVPVQSQVVSRSGQLVVWGDQRGKLQVRRFSSDGGYSKTSQAELQLKSAPAALTFSETEDQVLAANGFDIQVWNFETGAQTILSGHQNAITAICTAKDFVISSDEAGSIRAWSLTSGKQLWSIRCSSRIVDLVLLPQEKIFIYAGSRGGESADILAYRLNGLADSTVRPQRLGQLKLPRTRNNPPRALAVSSDGQKLLISNSRNGNVLVLSRRNSDSTPSRNRFPFVDATELDEQNAESFWIAARHQRPVNQMNFSADGKRFCTASDDRTIGIWEFSEDDTFHFVERLEGHGARVNGAVFTDSSGQLVSSVAADRYCRYWNLATYKQDKRKLEHEFRLSSARPTTATAKHRLADASQPAFRLPNVLASALLWKATSWSLPALLTKDLQSANDELEDTDARAEITLNVAPSVQRGAIQSVVVSNDGRFVTTGGSDGTAVIWDTQTKQPVTSVSTSDVKAGQAAAFDEGHDFNVSRFQFLPPHGHHLLTTGYDGNLCVWNSNTDKAGAGHQTLRLPGLGLVNAFATSSDGQVVVMSSVADNQQPGMCRVYRTDEILHQATPSAASELVGLHTAEISAIALNADGSRAVTGGRDGRVALWSCSDGRLLATSRIHARNTLVSFLKLLKNGTILSAGYDGRLMLLGVQETEENAKVGSLAVLQKFEHDRIPIERVAVSPDQNRFVTISIRTIPQTQKVQYEMNLWQIDQTSAMRPLIPAVVEERPAVRISSVDFSTDGNRMAAVVDQRLQIFDTSSWKVIRVVSSGLAGMSDAIFAPQTEAATAARDSALKVATFDGVAAQLWDLNSGTHLAEFRPLFSVKSVTRSQHAHPLLLTGDRSIRFFLASAATSRFGRCVFKIADPHSGTVNSMAFHPARPNLLASCGTDGDCCLWLWQATTNEASLVTRISGGDENENAVSVKWTHDGQGIWVAYQSGRLAKYDIGGTLQIDFRLPSEPQIDVADLDVRTDASFVAVCGKSRNGGQSLAWIFEQQDSKDLALHCRMEGHEAGGTSGIRFIPNSPYIVTVGADGACLVWNWMPERSEERPLQPYEAYEFIDPNSRVAHAAPINALSVTSHGDIVTVSDDGTAKLWTNPFAKAP